MSGRIMLQKSDHVVSNRLEINVSSISERTYMLRVKSSSDELTKRLLFHIKFEVKQIKLFSFNLYLIHEESFCCINITFHHRM